MTNTPEESEPGAEVQEGDVAENPTTPSENGGEQAHTAQDAEGDPPLDADEGDPNVDSYPS